MTSDKEDIGTADPVDGPPPAESEASAPQPNERANDTRTVVFSLRDRLLLTLATFVLATLWHKTQIGVQLGWALQFGLFLAVSIVASCWWLFAAVNSAIAGLWLWLSWRQRPVDNPRWRFADRLGWLNRQAEHIEVLATWVAVVLVWSHSLLWQLTGLAAVVFLGAWLVDALAKLKWVGRAEAAQSRAVLLMERRRVIYAATLLGLLALVARAWSQWRTALPLVLAVVLGLTLRWVRFGKRRRQERKDPRFVAYRRALATMQQDRASDWFGPAVVVLAFAGAFGYSLWARHALKAAANDEKDGRLPPADRCVAEPGGPKRADVAVFLIADTHVHELSGYRFPGQMEVADAIMPVSRRPVELDLLSSAPIIHFETVYKDIATQRQHDGLPPPTWAHLGDFANLSCADEMVRALDVIARYSDGKALLAGFAPGSHDMSFQGNFDWSPYWPKACNDARMDKAAMTPLLGQFLARAPLAAGETVERAGWELTRLSPGRPLSRFTISRLGELQPRPGQTKPRGVLGIFFDTTDRRTGNWGIGGAFGTFSSQQADAIRTKIRELRAQAGDGPWRDPWFVLLGHSPYAELTGSSKSELARLVADLDQPPPGCLGDACGEPRVLALLAAHVHTAGSHRQCMGNRLIREIIVGSTLDPPQQAALMEIGLDERNRAALRVSTLPAVERPGYACSPSYAVSALTCREVVAKLRAEPACADLLEGWEAPGFNQATCEEIERPLSLMEQIHGIAVHGGPDDADAIDDADRKRGRRMLQCLCRNSESLAANCAKALRDPLDDHATSAVIQSLARDPQRTDEVTCLGWAASAVQQHKASGMAMADALRCAFDDPTLQPAQVTTASSEEIPCY